MNHWEVAVPVPLRRTFTYSVAGALAERIQPGSRVVVPFGARRLVGVALAPVASVDEARAVRSVLDVLDEIPALPTSLLQLGRWVSHYYVAPVGEVFQAILPPAVDLKRSSRLHLTEAGQRRLQELEAQTLPGMPRPPELVWLQRVQAGRASAARWQREPILARLVREGWVEVRPPAPVYRERGRLVVAWEPTVEPAGEGEQRLAEVLRSAGALPLNEAAEASGLSRHKLLALARVGKLRLWREPDGERSSEWDVETFAPVHQLTAAQRAALDSVEQWLQQPEFVTGVLWGVTGSGKTEIYLRAAESVLRQGRDAILLVPEIALTYALGRQARARLGDCVAVLHSGLGERERWEQWWRIRRGQARVVVGTRLAVFAPVSRLGLLVVDEEQEPSYKQEETPRYHARDTAVMRAKLEQALVLLGSATPSLESFAHTVAGRYRLLELPTRVEDRPLPRIELVDLREEFRRTGRAYPLSSRLLAALEACLGQQRQALVLINRRGYSWFLLCRSCGATVKCVNCSLSLTYHRRPNRLLCHYCGYRTAVPRLCPECRSEHLHFYGEGSEQIEEYLQRQLTGYRVARLDRDSATGRHAYRRVLDAFGRAEVHVLVGTQMIAKGHDFRRVGVVGVLGIDRLLAMPDFRAAERAFQLLTQVAGRAGRGDGLGTVFVETYYPTHYAVQLAAQQDFRAFYEHEARFRRLLQFPPAVALANMIVHHRRLELVRDWTERLARFWGQHAAELRVLGPAPAPLARLKREHRFQFVLKSPSRSRLVRLLAASLEFCQREGIPESAVIVDMDPVQLL